MDLTFWLQLALFVFLLGLSAFFSSSETALFSLSSSKLEQMRRDGHPRIGLIQRMLSRPRRLIVTILIGNELVNVSASAISAAILIDMLGAENKWMNLFVMVPLLLLVGEITPKVLAIYHNAAFSSFQSYPLELFARIIKPLRWIVRLLSDLVITRIIGKKPSGGNIITEDMVRTLAYEAVGEGALDCLEAQFIDHIFDFGNKRLEDVMTLRSDIFALPIDMPLSQVVAEVSRTRHTKIPIYQGRRDNIAGILHVRDLVGVNIKKVSEEAQGFYKFLRKPYFVPESKSAVNLFRTFRERKQSIALTVDEYGGVTGLVTMEDLLECIFGEIHSPSDTIHQVQIKDLGNGCFESEGKTSISDFNSKMGTDLSDQWGETIGGVLLHHYGELPPEGATLELAGLKFTFTDVGDNRIRRVQFERIETNPENETETSSDFQTETCRMSNQEQDGDRRDDK